MVEIWYAITCFMLTMYVVLEGLDIGAGMLQYMVGKTDAERRLVIAAIGPLWQWNEVWLIGFGGVLFMAFPTIFAESFAGFYLALFLLLWALIGRGIALEVSGHLADSMWRTAFHVVFVASNLLLAILIGAALGNVVRGIPLGAEGKWSLPFFTHFGVRGEVGILDWYTISFALFFLTTFAAHGANALALKTDGPVHDRSLALAKLFWRIVPVLAIVVSIESWLVRGDLMQRMLPQPIAWLGLIAAIGGLAAVWTGLQNGREGRALAGSSAFIAGLMTAGAAGNFPTMLHSTLSPEYSLTAYQGAAPGYGLSVALIWWPISAVLSIGYAWFVYRYYRGKVKSTDDLHSPY